MYHAMTQRPTALSGSVLWQALEKPVAQFYDRNRHSAEYAITGRPVDTATLHAPPPPPNKSLRLRYVKYTVGLGVAYVRCKSSGTRSCTGSPLPLGLA